MYTLNFNIVFPIFDYLFGTVYHPPQETQPDETQTKYKTTIHSYVEVILTWTSYFHEKTILITGAGNGIGRGLAISLSQYCKSLILIDIHESNLEETASLCSERALVHRLILDVRDAQNVVKNSYLAPVRI